MTITGIFGLEYKAGSRRYSLSNTELCCIDQAQEKNNFSIPLNKLSPYYSYGIAYSPLWILFVGYLSIAVITKSIEWFNGSPLFDFRSPVLGVIGITQLIIFPLFLAYAGWQFYREFKTAYSFCFRYRYGNIAFFLPIDKKNKAKTEEFLTALTSKIHNITPANEDVLALLWQYGLLTKTEATQLDAHIQQSKSGKNTKENIIHLEN